MTARLEGCFFVSGNSIYAELLEHHLQSIWGCLGDNRLSLDSIMQNSGGIWVVLGPHLIVSSKIGVGVSVSMVIAR